MTQQINTCACADRADRVFSGDVVIAKDAAGAGGNLTVEKTLTVGTLVAGNIAVEDGNAVAETVTFQTSPGTLEYTIGYTAQSSDVIAAVYDAAGNLVGVDLQIVSDSLIKVTFGAVPETAATFKAVIIQKAAVTVTPSDSETEEEEETE